MGRSTLQHLAGAVRRGLLAALGLALAGGPLHAMPPSSPFLRVPQVQVNGTGLQAYFASVGEGINVQTDQVNAELLRGDSSYWVFPDGPRSTNFFLQLELGPHTPGTTLGIYDGHSGAANRVPVFPDTAGPGGWFAVLSWRTSPTRLIVNLFDAQAAFKGTRTYLGGPDRYGIGFYLETPHATYFTQDALNPAGEPRCLFYRGTGIDTGSIWLAWEDGDAPADRDFDDSIVFVETSSEGPWFTATQRATWGALKARFR